MVTSDYLGRQRVSCYLHIITYSVSTTVYILIVNHHSWPEQNDNQAYGLQPVDEGMESNLVMELEAVL